MYKYSLYYFIFLLVPFVQAQDFKPLEIVITGGLVPVTRDHVGTSVTVITSKQIEQQSYDFVSDILQDVPGLSMVRNGGPGSLSEVRIRGAESDQTLVLIDGIEANDPAFSSGFDFAHLLAQSIDKIEILRGAQSALWGSDAIGGIINIITKSGKGLEKHESSISGQYGSFSTKNLAAATRGNSGIFDYALSLQQFNSNGYSSASENTFTYNLADGTQITTGGNSEDDAYENTTAHLKLGLELTQNFQIDGVIRYTDFENEFDSFTTIPVDSIPDRSDGDQTYYLLQGRYAQMSGALNHTLKYFGNNSNADFYSSFGKTVSEGEKNHYAYQLDYDWNSDSYGHGVSFLLETEEDKLNSTFSGNREVKNDSAVFEYRFNNRSLAAAANFRHDENDLFDNENNWRMSGSWKFAPTMRIHTSYGTGIKNPTLVELFGFTSDFIGNQNLSPEQSNDGDIGIEYISNDGRQLLDVIYFHRKINDLIIGSGNTAINIDGESTSKGLELAYDSHISNQLGFYSTYTYNDSQDSDGNQLIRRPKHQFSAGVNYALLNHALKLALTVRHVKDRTDNTFNADFTSSAVELDDYTTADVSARYSINENLSLKARVDNLFNEKYEEVLGYGTSERAYYIGLSGSF